MQALIVSSMIGIICLVLLFAFYERKELLASPPSPPPQKPTERRPLSKIESPFKKTLDKPFTNGMPASEWVESELTCPFP